MADKERVPVGCSVCNRIMWPEGVDREGRCEDCRPSVQQAREREERAAEKEAEAAAKAEADRLAKEAAEHEATLAEQAEAQSHPEPESESEPAE
jgi:hypothetical protein